MAAKPFRASRFLIAAAFIPVAFASPVMAQEAADQVPPKPQTVPEATEPTKPAGPGAATPSPTGQVEEIVVTAERREQRLQDLPISASVFSANEIARRGISNIADIQQAAPSVAINTVNRSTFINIRGVGIVQSAPTSNPGIAYYIDGQLIPHEQFISQSFYDIGAIEVLRGPQGTLTGQNSTGGAIYVRTPEPNFDRLTGFGELTFGNYGSRRYIGALNLPFDNNVAIRVAAVHDERDSFSENIGTSDSTPGAFNLNSVRANLALRTTNDVLKINLRGEWFDYSSDNIAVKNRGDLVLSLRDALNPFDPRQADEFVINEDAHSFLNQRGYRASGEIRYDIMDSVRLRALTSWQDGYTHDQADGDRGRFPVNPAQSTVQRRGRVSYASTDFKTWINEVNLISIGKGPFQWVLGGFYLKERIPLLQLRDDRSSVDIVSATLNRTVTQAHNTSKSLFGQANWYVTPQIELVAGARYSWDKQFYERFEVSRTITAGVTTPVLDQQPDGTAKSSELTGKLAANYHFDNGTLVYASASKGYKAGGVNLTAGAPNFKPENNFVYEAGVKTDFFDRHLRANASIFMSRYKDIQLASLLNGLPLTQNAASGESWGGELELTGQFAQLGFNLGIGYLDSQFSKDVCLQNTNNPPGTPALCGGTTNELVPEGRPLPLAPKWTINAGVQYAIPLSGDFVLTPRLQWSYLSKQYGTPFPSVFSIVPHRSVADARLTLDILNQYRVEAFVTNFTNKTYISSQIQNASSANGGYVFGAPRQYGLRLTAKF